MSRSLVSTSGCGGQSHVRLNEFVQFVDSVLSFGHHRLYTLPLRALVHDGAHKCVIKLVNLPD